MDDDHEALSRIINKKTSEIFSKYQNLDHPMDWNTAKSQAVTELTRYIMYTFLEIPEPDYGEYADLSQFVEEGINPEDIAKDFNFGGRYANMDQEELEEQQEPGIDPEQYNDMKFSDFLRSFDFYKENASESTNTNQPQHESVQD